MKPTIQARDALASGVRLQDYDIEGLLGVGGFGLVYRARDESLQRDVAIKEYLPSSMAGRGDDGRITLRSPEYAESFALGMRSFINEARLLARFDHPALVRVIRFWEDRGTAYMVMPCYEGPTLYEARRELGGPPTEAWLRALMEPLLGALECLHREQVYHRDVAPDNILLIDDPDLPGATRPLLLDFGAARRVISDHTQALTAILKPSFAPIEQYAETTTLKQGPWTDLYGLAAVLHYCITGRTPVPATARAVHDDLPSLVRMAPALTQDFGRDYSLALLATIDQALSVNPENRPASVAAWRESLAAVRPAGDAIGANGIGANGKLADPEAGSTQLEPRRAVWNERTVVANLQPLPPVSFAPTVPGHAAGASAHTAWPMAQGPWPRPLVWGVGAAVLASVIALSAWSVKRHHQDGTGPVASVSSLALAAASMPDIPPATGASQAVKPAPFAEANASRPSIVRARSGRHVRSEAGDSLAERQQESSVQARKAPSDAQPLNPRHACGGRIFIAMAFCMKRYCSRPQYSQHAECAHMRAQERSQRDSQRGYP